MCAFDGTQDFPDCCGSQVPEGYNVQYNLQNPPPLSEGGRASERSKGPHPPLLQIMRFHQAYLEKSMVVFCCPTNSSHRFAQKVSYKQLMPRGRQFLMLIIAIRECYFSFVFSFGFEIIN